jgi:hypothetical protein
MVSLLAHVAARLPRYCELASLARRNHAFDAPIDSGCSARFKIHASVVGALQEPFRFVEHGPGPTIVVTLAFIALDVSAES